MKNLPVLGEVCIHFKNLDYGRQRQNAAYAGAL